MLYQTYQSQDDLVGQLRYAARWFRLMLAWGGGSAPMRRLDATLEMIERLRLTQARPDFHIPRVLVGNREAVVTERVVLDLPFGKLLHFAKDVDTPQPKVPCSRRCRGISPRCSPGRRGRFCATMTFISPTGPTRATCRSRRGGSASRTTSAM